MELPDEPNESDTERDGLLSYATEWHALIVGGATGLYAGYTANPHLYFVVLAVALGIIGAKRFGPTDRVRALGEVAAEPWYALAGLSAMFMVGVFL